MFVIVVRLDWFALHCPFDLFYRFQEVFVSLFARFLILELVVAFEVFGRDFDTGVVVGAVELDNHLALLLRQPGAGGGNDLSRPEGMTLKLVVSWT